MNNGLGGRHMKKDPFHKRIVKAIKDPNFVARAPKEKTNSLIGYMVVLILILAIPASIVKGVVISNEMNNLLEAVEGSAFPDFQLKDGEFSIDSDEPIIIEQDKLLKVIIDVDGNKNINDLAGYDTGYLLTKDLVTITMKGQSPAYYKLEAFQALEFTKSMFVSQLEFMTSISIFVVPLVVIIISLFNSFFRSFMLLILAFILKNMLQLEGIRGSDLYKIVLYSMTLGVILYETLTLIPLFINLPISPDILATLAPIVLFYLPSSTIMSRALRLRRMEQDMSKAHKGDVE